eukprot:gene4919-7598_t
MSRGARRPELVSRVESQLRTLESLRDTLKLGTGEPSGPTDTHEKDSTPAVTPESPTCSTASCDWGDEVAVTPKSHSLADSARQHTVCTSALSSLAFSHRNQHQAAAGLLADVHDPLEASVTRLKRAADAEKVYHASLRNELTDTREEIEALKRKEEAKSRLVSGTAGKLAISCRGGRKRGDDAPPRKSKSAAELRSAVLDELRAQKETEARLQAALRRAVDERKAAQRRQAKQAEADKIVVNQMQYRRRMSEAALDGEKHAAAAAAEQALREAFRRQVLARECSPARKRGNNAQAYTSQPPPHSSRARVYSGTPDEDSPTHASYDAAAERSGNSPLMNTKASQLRASIAQEDSSSQGHASDFTEADRRRPTRDSRFPAEDLRRPASPHEASPFPAEDSASQGHAPGFTEADRRRPTRDARFPAEDLRGSAAPHKTPPFSAEDSASQSHASGFTEADRRRPTRDARFPAEGLRRAGTEADDELGGAGHRARNARAGSPGVDSLRGAQSGESSRRRRKGWSNDDADEGAAWPSAARSGVDADPLRGVEAVTVTEIEHEDPPAGYRAGYDKRVGAKPAVSPQHGAEGPDWPRNNGFGSAFAGGVADASTESSHRRNRRTVETPAADELNAERGCHAPGTPDDVKSAAGVADSERYPREGCHAENEGQGTGEAAASSGNEVQEQGSTADGSRHRAGNGTQAAPHAAVTRDASEGLHSPSRHSPVGASGVPRRPAGTIRSRFRLLETVSSVRHSHEADDDGTRAAVARPTSPASTVPNAAVHSHARLAEERPPARLSQADQGSAHALHEDAVTTPVSCVSKSADGSSSVRAPSGTAGVPAACVPQAQGSARESGVHQFHHVSSPPPPPAADAPEPRISSPANERVVSLAPLPDRRAFPAGGDALRTDSSQADVLQARDSLQADTLQTDTLQAGDLQQADTLQARDSQQADTLQARDSQQAYTLRRDTLPARDSQQAETLQAAACPGGAATAGGACQEEAAPELGTAAGPVAAPGAASREARGEAGAATALPGAGGSFATATRRPDDDGSSAASSADDAQRVELPAAGTARPASDGGRGADSEDAGRVETSAKTGTHDAKPGLKDATSERATDGDTTGKEATNEQPRADTERRPANEEATGARKEAGRTFNDSARSAPHARAKDAGKVGQEPTPSSPRSSERGGGAKGKPAGKAFGREASTLRQQREKKADCPSPTASSPRGGGGRAKKQPGFKPAVPGTADAANLAPSSPVTAKPSNGRSKRSIDPPAPTPPRSTNHSSGGTRAAAAAAQVDPAAEEAADKIKEEANAAYKASKYPEAVQLYTKALAQAPQSAALHLNRSAAHMMLHHLPEALKDADRARFLEAIFRMAKLNMMMGNFSVAKNLYNRGQALREPPQNECLCLYAKRLPVKALNDIELALQHKGNQNWEDAVRAAESACAAVPCLHFQLIRCDILIMADPKKAKLLLEGLARTHPKEPDVHHLRGKALFYTALDKLSTNAALQHLATALLLSGGHPKARTLQMVISTFEACRDEASRCFELKLWPQAAAAYTKALSLDSANHNLKTTVLLLRATVHAHQGNNAGALEDCSAAILFDDRNHRAYFRRAQCHKKMKNAVLELKDLKTAAKLQPGCQDYHDALSRAEEAFLTASPPGKKPAADTGKTPFFCRGRAPHQAEKPQQKPERQPRGADEGGDAFGANFSFSKTAAGRSGRKGGARDPKPNFGASFFFNTKTYEFKGFKTFHTATGGTFPQQGKKPDANPRAQQQHSQSQRQAPPDPPGGDGSSARFSRTQSTSVPNLYAILAVPPSGSQGAIKAAYHKGALTWHPDKWITATDEEKSRAEAKFRELQDAYCTLGDTAKRQAYDRARTVMR